MSSWNWDIWRQALRRGWWIGVLVAALVVLGAGAQYLRAARDAPFVATQTLRLALLEPATTSTSQVAAAGAYAASIGRLLASGGLLASPAPDAAIADRLRADEPTLAGVTPGVVAARLSATHNASTVTLYARWSSAEGAEALLRAAVETLQDGGLAGEQAVAALVPVAAVLQVYAVGAPSAAARDADALAAARSDLLVRIGLGLLAGLLAALGGGLVLARRSPAVVQSERTPEA